MNKIIGFVGVTTILGFAACKHDPLVFFDEPDIPIIIEDACDPDSVYFENDVLPILISNCAISGCHDPETQEEGIILSTYEDIMGSDVISIGDPYDSDMIKAIQEDDPDDRMPPEPQAPLSSEEIIILATWMEQGAVNNSCADCDTTTEVTYSVTVTSIISNYCLGCHSGSSPSGSIDLSTYEGVAIVAANGSLIGSISHEPGYVSMPLGGSSILPCHIDNITAWVESGYPDN